MASATALRRRRYRRTRFVRPLVLTIAVVLIMIWTVVPVAWIVIMSVQKEINYIAVPMHLRWADINFHWYRTMLASPDFVRTLENSVIISSATTVACLMIGSLAAYSLARLRVPRQNLFLVMIVGSQTLPAMVLIIPIFLLVRRLHLYDTYFALILVNTVFLLPYTIWMLKTFFERIPVSLESAARMDGCSRLGVLFRIVIPISAPGVVATAVYAFIGSWNEFLFGLVLTARVAKPVMVTLSEYTGSDYLPDMSQVAAAGVISVLPVIVLAMILNRFIIRGMVEGIKA